MVEQVFEDARVQFQCCRCGNCCRHVKEQILVEPMDAFYMARHLGCKDMGELYDNYTCPTLLQGLYPVFLMQVKGPDDACVFLEGGQCSIYEARPRTCRIYPFSINPNVLDGSFRTFQNWDQHEAHFTGPLISVEEWMRENFNEEAQAFLLTEYRMLPKLAAMLQQITQDEQMRFYSQVIFLHYFNYDLNQSFLLQHSANLEELKRRLERAI